MGLPPQILKSTFFLSVYGTLTETDQLHHKPSLKDYNRVENIDQIFSDYKEI